MKWEKIRGTPVASSVYTKPIPGTLTRPRLGPSPRIQAIETLPRLTRLVLVLKLNRGVRNAELAPQILPDLVSDGFAFRGWHIQNMDMTGHGMKFRSQAPHVNVMNLANAGNGKHRVCDTLQAHSLWKALQQNV